jgi:hypothetical protein
MLNDVRKNPAKQDMKIAHDMAMGYNHPLHIH